MDDGSSNIQILWNKIPLIIRVVILGFVISTLGVGISVLVYAFVPMPWSFFLMIGLLWVYIKYFSGSWWPENTQSFRRVHFRSLKMTRRQWMLSGLAILLIVLIEQSGLVVTFRLVAFPAAQFIVAYSFLAEIPTWAAWLVVIMISAVAGICEETGFRGYMQLPLENKYGPVISISIVSLVFVLVHLHQAWSGPLIVHIFFISALFGTLAYYAKSLIPGIIAHFIMDICNFSFWWSDLGGQFDRQTIGVTGIDTHFLIWSGVLILGILVFVMIMRKMRRGLG